VKHLLIDENLPASLALLLPVTCSHATDIGQQPTDTALWTYARQRDWTILTRDTDFFDRLMLEGPPPKNHLGSLGQYSQRGTRKPPIAPLSCHQHPACQRRPR